MLLQATLQATRKLMGGGVRVPRQILSPGVRFP